MKAENRTGFKTMQVATSPLPQHVRVTVNDSGLLTVAGESDFAIGISTEIVPGGTHATVKLWSSAGTFQVLASGLIPIGARLYAAADGAVSATGTCELGLRAIEAATASGDIIEVCTTDPIPSLGGSRGVTISDVAPSDAPSSPSGVWIHNTTPSPSLYFWNGTAWQLLFG